MLRWFQRQTTRAARIAAEDRRAAAACTGRRFTTGTRPVIRWIKGDGLDDHVTRAAIAQATRLFGAAVDYCLCTEGIAAPRAREILSWSVQPVEWWPVTEHDNPVLARLLRQAECPPEHFGYWWKWFPERVRPGGPEWILDGDMVITGKPAWFDQWLGGHDRIRVSQDDRATPAIYGRYSASVDPALQLYSGLVSLPSDLRFMRQFQKVLAAQRLVAPHDGRSDMCEQGVVAAAFQRLDAVPIPLHEFPFARAFEDFIDHGVEGDRGRAWGYHFGNAFRRDNPHFHRLVAEGVVFSQPEPDLHDRFEWLGGVGQWGIPGWTMPPDNTRNLVTRAAMFSGRDVLEIGTSRGRVTAQLATLGCNVTSVDHQDRGASGNLAGLGVDVVVDDAVHWLTTSGRSFDLVVCDVHGNSPAEWRRFSEPLQRAVRPGGTMILNNAALARIPEWHEETGVPWFLDSLPAGWTYEVDTSTAPGLAVVTRP